MYKISCVHARDFLIKLSALITCYLPVSNDAGAMLCRCSCDDTVDNQILQVLSSSTPLTHHPRHCVDRRLQQTRSRDSSGSRRRRVYFRKLRHKRKHWPTYQLNSLTRFILLASSYQYDSRSSVIKLSLLR